MLRRLRRFIYKKYVHKINLILYFTWKKFKPKQKASEKNKYFYIYLKF